MEIDVSKMLEGIKSLKRAKRPVMSDGMKYLHDLFCNAAVKGEEICFGDINFDRFTMEELNEYDTLYSGKILQNHSAAEKVIQTLCGSEPTSTTVRNFF